MEAELKKLLVSATRGVSELDAIVINHSAWSSPVYITPDITPGFTGQLETGQVVEFIYAPCKIKRAAQQNNLSQRFELTIQDLNEIIAPLTDLIPLDSDEYPTIEFRTFVYSDDTISTVQDGPYRLNATDSIMTSEGFKTTAQPRNVNQTGTGRRMTPNRIPMMRGFQ